MKRLSRDGGLFYLSSGWDESHNAFQYHVALMLHKAAPTCRLILEMRLCSSKKLESANACP